MNRWNREKIKENSKLAPNIKPIKKNGADFYEYNPPPINPPPIIIEASNPNNTPAPFLNVIHENPMNTNSGILLSPIHHNNEGKINNPEIDQWSITWKEAVDILTEITEFPSFLVQTIDDQRKSLIELVKKVVEIAKNPKEAQEYKTLMNLLEEKEKTISDLTERNQKLQNEIDQMKINHNDEIINFSKRIGVLQSYALQIEHITNQVDKRKDQLQANFQRFIPSRSPSSELKNTDFQPIQQNGTDNNNNNGTNNNKSKKTLLDKSKKVGKNSNKNKNIKKNSDKSKDDKKRESLPDKKGTKISVINDQNKFEEDYVSKLIQKYTKKSNSPEKNDQNEKNDENVHFSLFERSLKPTETKNKEEIPGNSILKRRKWH